MVDLYEAVQHAPALLPRLYLLITVGSVYIQSHEEGSHRILEDLIEMLRVIICLIIIYIFAHTGCTKPLERTFPAILLLENV